MIQNYSLGAAGMQQVLQPTPLRRSASHRHCEGLIGSLVKLHQAGRPALRRGLGPSNVLPRPTRDKQPSHGNECAWSKLSWNKNLSALPWLQLCEPSSWYVISVCRAILPPFLFVKCPLLTLLWVQRWDSIGHASLHNIGLKWAFHGAKKPALELQKHKYTYYCLYFFCFISIYLSIYGYMYIYICFCMCVRIVYVYVCVYT